MAQCNHYRRSCFPSDRRCGFPSPPRAGFFFAETAEADSHRRRTLRCRQPVISDPAGPEPPPNRCPNALGSASFAGYFVGRRADLADPPPTGRTTLLYRQGRQSHPVVRPGFKPGWGRQPFPGEFDSHCLPPILALKAPEPRSLQLINRSGFGLGVEEVSKTPNRSEADGILEEVRRKVRIAHRHVQRGMAQDLLQSQDVAAVHHEV